MFIVHSMLWCYLQEGDNDVTQLESAVCQAPTRKSKAVPLMKLHVTIHVLWMSAGRL